MPLPSPELGLVISYGYLWRTEHERGQEEGVKDRPCVIILAIEERDGRLMVTVMPVTHSPPSSAEEAVEIPQVTKRRLGLDEARSWIVVNEGNEFRWPGPDLRPIKPEHFAYGFLPPNLLRQVQERFSAYVAANRSRVVPRTE